MLKKFRLYLLLIILVELFSLGSFWLAQNNLPIVREIALVVIIVITLLLAVHKLEYGLLILFTELFISSKGHLFFYEYDGFTISLRMGLFFIVMSAWLGKVILQWASAKRDIQEDIDDYIVKSKKIFKDFTAYRNFADNLKGQFKKTTSAKGILSFYFLLFIFIIWGVVNGYLQENNLKNIFFDFNGWIYFGILFPARHIFYNNKDDQVISRWQKDLLVVFSAAITWLSLKTIFLLYLFTHKFSFLNAVYLWIRKTGVGEITFTEYGFYRIFFQSHMFVAAGLFIFLALTLHYWLKGDYRKLFYCYIVKLLCAAAILVSLSRSFWLGLAVGLVFYLFIILLFYYKEWRAILKWISASVLAGALSVALIYGVVKFPIPESISGFDASMFKDRALEFNDAAGSSRWNLLPALAAEIKKAPLLGQGFGATATYKTQDPRVLASNPSGEYTTYAFEWGWLDIWLKIGLLGALVYIAMIIKIFYDGIKISCKLQVTSYKLLSISLLAGLIMVVVTSIFSPYLNHPLEIGYLVLASVIFNKKF